MKKHALARIDPISTQLDVRELTQQMRTDLTTVLSRYYDDSVTNADLFDMHKSCLDACVEIWLRYLIYSQ